MTSRTLKLTIAYDGTRYVGWQRQANGHSIQGILEAAIEAIVGAPTPVAGAGRTDAGVHASGQVASTVLHHSIEIWQLVRALNGMLPPDIRVARIEEVAPEFHARFSPSTKTYAYRLARGSVLSPFERAFAWHHPGPLDVPAMRQAAALLIGEHDFKGFQGAGGDVVRTVRCVVQACVEEVPSASSAAIPGLPGTHQLVIRLTANGFLRHMVRIIVGTLVDVGRGRRSAEDLREILARGDRRLAGPTAPARGLVLERVDYVTVAASAGPHGLLLRRPDAKINDCD